MPRLYNNEEYAAMVRCYYQSEENGERAARLYRQEYPNIGRYPSGRVIIRAVERLVANANARPNLHVEHARPERERIIDEVERLVEADGTMSSREIARVTCTQYSVHKVLTDELGLRAWHFTPVHALGKY